jgi:hypothetical protein
VDPVCEANPHGHHGLRKFGRCHRTRKRRWQCSFCKQTTIFGPGVQTEPRRRGPQPGGVLQPEKFAAYWSELEHRITAVGLYEAVHQAGRSVGVHESTARRWIGSPPRLREPSNGWSSGQWLTRKAIERIRERRGPPKMRAVESWRAMVGWDKDEVSLGSVKPRATVELSRNSREISSLLYKAAAVACVVVGDGGPLTLAEVPHVDDKDARALREGGLLNRVDDTRRFTYWLDFGSYRSGGDYPQPPATPVPPGKELDGAGPFVTALVCTRTRVVGLHSEALFSWPRMTVRLDLDRARSSLDGIPVPGANFRSGNRLLTFPLKLSF